MRMNEIKAVARLERKGSMVDILPAKKREKEFIEENYSTRDILNFQHLWGDVIDGFFEANDLEHWEDGDVIGFVEFYDDDTFYIK
jgi:hypothetical protein